MAGGRSPNPLPPSRLRPASIDPLDAIGLPSKGETRLNNPKAQEDYFRLILQRYRATCGSGLKDIEQSFASLAVASESLLPDPPHPSFPRPHDALPALLAPHTRKLREALLSTHRFDAFTSAVYLFVIRSAILSKRFESYHPALLSVINVIHPVAPAAFLAQDYAEVVGYHILDLACRQHDLNEAFGLYGRERTNDRHILKILKALATGNWVAFHRCKGEEKDMYRRKILEIGLEKIQRHAVACMAQVYFTADISFVEISLGLPWREVMGQLDVGWDFDERAGRVVIRKQRSR